MGPENVASLNRSVSLLDDRIVDGSLWLVRKLSSMRWEDSATCRIGARMGRPEKSGVREMKPLVHSLYPIAESGGPQRLLGEACSKGSIRVQMGPRVCSKWFRVSTYQVSCQT